LLELRLVDSPSWTGPSRVLWENTRPLLGSLF
jgi:hypothetical protein